MDQTVEVRGQRSDSLGQAGGCGNSLGLTTQVWGGSSVGRSLRSQCRQTFPQIITSKRRTKSRKSPLSSCSHSSMMTPPQYAQDRHEGQKSCMLLAPVGHFSNHVTNRCQTLDHTPHFCYKGIVSAHFVARYGRGSAACSPTDCTPWLAV